MARRTNRSNRRSSKVIIPRSVNTIHTVKRKLVGLINKTATDAGVYQQIRLVDFPGQGDFLSLFQFYRIKQIELKFMLTDGLNSLTAMPTLYIAPSYSVLTGSPANRDEVLQYQGVRTHQFGPTNTTFSITTAPRVLLDSSSAGIGGTEKASPWLSSANNGILHSCFVYWLTRYNTTTATALDIEFNAIFECKGTR